MRVFKNTIRQNHRLFGVAQKFIILPHFDYFLEINNAVLHYFLKYISRSNKTAGEYIFFTRYFDIAIVR